MKTPSYMRQKLPVVLVAGLGGLFTVVDVACAQPWATTDAPNLSWKALASSADGTRLVAAANTQSYTDGVPAPIYVSTNAGATWIQTGTPSNNWSSVACSADGTKLVAVASLHGPNGVPGDGLIYTSPDLGATWTPTSALSNNWTSVASSADGAKLVAVAAPHLDLDTNGDWHFVGDGAIYRSQNSGATWTRTSAPSTNWSAVASSADGNKLVAVVAHLWDGHGNLAGAGAIYSSLDSGASWTQTSAPTNDWTSVASSVDGAKLVAVAAPQLVYNYTNQNNDYVGDGAIYRSLDSGATWTRTSAPSNAWSAVASSADGTRLVAANNTYGGFDPASIYISTNSGNTWTATGAPREWCSAVACSADGTKVVAAAVCCGGYPMLAGGWIYTLPYSGPWRSADAPAENWSSVASSANGAKLVAVAWSGAICTSSNSGATWARTSARINYCTSVASSADGDRLVAVAPRNYFGDGAIYTSLDSGATWSRTSAPTNYWTSVASSADGARLVAVGAFGSVWNGTNYDSVGDGAIYTSLDSGATWSRTSAPTNSWTSVASSADGAKWVAVADPNYGGDGLIYTSSNSGVTWTLSSATTNGWSSVASSADGAKLVAVAAPFWNPNVTNYAGDGGIYCSVNAGATWMRTSAPSNGWSSVASSADGIKLVALIRSHDQGGVDSIYISTNAGATWTTPVGEPAASSWNAVASPADGSNIVAAGENVICTLRSPAPAPPLPPSPLLAVGLSGASLGLSWLVPSTRFVLQQNSDLSSTNWVDVPTPPTLDYTNLHQRVTLTPSLGSSYYRLKQQ